jgi:hypothetical protein
MEIREILDRTDLAALLTELSGQPVGQGHRRRWPCIAPDHPDEHPSVSMFVDRNGIERWRCWSDGQSGTAIDAAMISRNSDVRTAISWLTERSGHTPPPAPRIRRPVAEARPPSTELRRWANECEHRLWRPEGTGALEWLRARGLDDDTLRANRIGYDPGRHNAPRARGLPRWRGVTVCSFDRHGELAYVQVRNLDVNAESKYSNPVLRHGSLPPVTFPRGGPVDGPLIVTEGVFDGLIATQAGYRAAALISTASVAATSGTRACANQIARHAAGQPIVLALDGDSAGRRAAEQLRHDLTGHDVQTLRIPDNRDLTSLYTQRNTVTCPPQTAPTRTASNTSSRS